MNESNSLNLGGAPLKLDAQSSSKETTTEIKKEEVKDINFSNELPKDAEVAMENVELPDPSIAEREGTVEDSSEDDIAGELLKEAAAAVEQKEEVTSVQQNAESHVEEKKNSVNEIEITETKEEDSVIKEEFSGLFEVPKLGDKKKFNNDDDGADLLFNQIITGTGDDVNEYITKHFKSNKALYAALEDEDAFVTHLANANRNGLGNDNMIANGSIVQENDLYKKIKPHNETSVVKDAFTHGADYTSKDGSVFQLSGKKARIAVTARMRGIQKINLMNSGFYIIVRAPNLAELSEFTTSVDLTAKEMGRQIGGHFGLCMDVFTKAKFIELLSDYGLIIDSNFPDIDKKGALAQYMSLLDYDVAIHGVISLMYRNGLRIKLVCPKCQNIEPNNLIDIASAKYMNTDLFTDKVAEYWGHKHDEQGRPVIRSVKDVTDYRRTILGYEDRVVQDQGDCSVAFVLKDPTMARYLTIGEKLITKINASLHSSGTQREEEIKYNSALHLYQMFAPWVSKMQILNPDRSVNFETTDTDTIIDALDRSVQKKFNFVDDINTFINKYKFDHIGTFAIECPKCHSKPDLGLDDFYPLDVETIFFALACHQ